MFCWLGPELFIWGGTADSSRIETIGICRFSLFFFFPHWIVININSKDKKMQSEKNKPDQQVVNTSTEYDIFHLY